jgi:hypothetical protein
MQKIGVFWAFLVTVFNFLKWCSSIEYIIIIFWADFQKLKTTT